MEIVPYTTNAPPFNADWLLDPAEIAQRIGGTDFVPRGLRENPAAITAALLYGQEIGLGIMASLATISVIDGKPTLAAEAQRALILAAGHEVGFEEATESRCIAWGRRKGQREVTRVTWTIDDAKRAGLAGRNAWRTYPRQMLVARASAELAREVFPDVLHGLAATEEVAEGADPAPGAEPDPTPPAPDKPKTRRRRRTKAAEQEPAEGNGGEGGEAQAAQPSGPEVGMRSEPSAPVPADEGHSEGHSEGHDEGPLPWNDEQRGALFAMFREVGLGGDDMREARLGYTSRIIQRPIESSAELTFDEASSLLTDLHRIEGLEPDERWRELLPERELRLIEEGDDLGGTWSDP